MISLFDRASLERAVLSPVRADLKSVLHARIQLTLKGGLGDLTHLVVVERRDSEQTLVNAIGFSPLNDPLGGARYGSPGFTPGWAWLADLGGWFEMIWTISDSGFAVVLLIENSDTPIADLARAYAVNPGGL